MRLKKIGLVVGIVLIITIAISSIVIYNYITYDPYMGVKPDIPDVVNMVEMGLPNRPAEGQGTSIRLGNTEFLAGLSLVYYTDESDKDWDYCTIQVCREIGDTYYVFFKRQLDISDVPEEIIKMAGDALPLREARVVTFDENSGMVTFTVGEKIFTYKLPEKQ
jgi:hypothetical protein